MIKLIDTDVVTFEMEQAYMLNRGARLCCRRILEKAPEVRMEDCVVMPLAPLPERPFMQESGVEDWE